MATKKVSRRPAPKAAPKPKASGAEAVTKTRTRKSRMDEEALLAKYPHALPGTLEFEEDGKYAGKQTVEIACQEPGCKAVRRIATSDLFQITMCTEHVLSNRKARRQKAKAKSN